MDKKGGEEEAGRRRKMREAMETHVPHPVISLDCDLHSSFSLYVK
jgi:hypothetical protein